MKKKRHSVEQIMRILREADGGRSVLDICREHNISEQTFHRWKRKYRNISSIGSSLGSNVVLGFHLQAAHPPALFGGHE